MPRIYFDPISKEYKTEYEEPEKEKDEKIRPEIIPYQDQMSIRKLYGGLPIYNTSSGVNPKVGEIYLIQAGSSKRICARFEGITVSSSLT